MALQNYSKLISLPSATQTLLYRSIAGKKYVPFIRALALPQTLTSRIFDSFPSGYGDPTKRTFMQGTTFVAVGQTLAGQADSYGWATRERNLVKNKAYAKFKDKAYSSAEVGVALAEARESLDLITKRLLTMAEAYRYLRRGKVRKCLKTLRIERLREKQIPADVKRWRKTRDASGLWLEYWMGWGPMVGDIYSAVDVLQQEFPLPAPTVASSGMKSQYVYNSGTASQGTKEVVLYSVFCRVSAVLSVTNPNLMLANQLGLVNPASVALQVVPFSWLFGWFVNLQEWIDGFTDWVGMTVKDPQYTLYVPWKGTLSKWGLSGTEYYRWEGPATGAYTTRTLSLPGVTLGTRNLKALSKSRAATAISLVVQLFSPQKQRSGQ